MQKVIISLFLSNKITTLTECRLLANWLDSYNYILPKDREVIEGLVERMLEVIPLSLPAYSRCYKLLEATQWVEVTQNRVAQLELLEQLDQLKLKGATE